MTINHFRQLAAYNRWANARLYAAALDLPSRHIAFTSGFSLATCMAHSITCCSPTDFGSND